MRGSRIRVAVGLVALLVVGLLWLTFVSPQRADLSAFGQLVVAVGALAVSAATLAVALRPSSGESDPLALLADRLADAVAEQWTDEARHRGLDMAGLVTVRWAVVDGPDPRSGGRPVDPLRSGATGAAARPPRAGTLLDLHALYDGVPGNRLWIVGSSGSGKSAAAILLVRAALGRRERVREGREHVPVPVLVTPRDWRVGTDLLDWLVPLLQQTYTGLPVGRRGRERVRELVLKGRVSLVLDAIDEMPAEDRREMLRQLNLLSSTRIVLLSRDTETVDGRTVSVHSEETVFDGPTVVELSRLSAADIGAFLTEARMGVAPPHWATLIDAVATEPPGGPLVAALGDPLHLTLLRDNFRNNDPGLGKLLTETETTSPEATAHHIRYRLMGEMLETVYDGRDRPGPGAQAPAQDRAPATSRYHGRTERTLQLVAGRMTRRAPDGEMLVRGLGWWQISEWVPATLLVTIVAVASGMSVVTGAVLWFGSGDPGDVGALVTAIAAVGTLGGALGAWSARQVSRSGPTRWQNVAARPLATVLLWAGLAFVGQGIASLYLESIAALGFAAALLVVVVLAYGVVLGGEDKTSDRLLLLAATGFVAGNVVLAALVYLVPDVLLIGLVVACLVVLGLGVRLALGRPVGRVVHATGPASSWKRGRVFSLVSWFGLGLPAGLLATAGGAGGEIGTVIALGLILIVGLVLGLTFPESWLTSAACLALWARHGTAPDLVGFLADAQQRGVLRSVGPRLEFRHRLLQRHLVGPELSSRETLRSASAVDLLEMSRPDTPPARWGEFIGRLRAAPNHPFTRSLERLDTRELVLDVCRARQSAAALLHLAKCDLLEETDVENRVLRLLVPRGNSCGVAHRGIVAEQRHVLTAVRLVGSRDSQALAWWDVPSLASAWSRALVVGVAVAAAVALGGEFLSRRLFPADFRVAFALAAGVGAAVAVVIASRRNGTSPAPLGPRNAPARFVVGVLVGSTLLFDLGPLAPFVGIAAALSTAAGLSVWLLITVVVRVLRRSARRADTSGSDTVPTPYGVLGLGTGATMALAAAGLVGGSDLTYYAGVVPSLVLLALALHYGRRRPAASETSGPEHAWRSAHVASTLVVWFAVIGYLGAFTIRAIGRIGVNLSPSLVMVALSALAALASAVMVGVAAALHFPVAGAASLAFLELALRQKAPWRLLTALDKARGAGLLRAEGDVYSLRSPDLPGLLPAATPAGSCRSGRSARSEPDRDAADRDR